MNFLQNIAVEVVDGRTGDEAFVIASVTTFK